MTFVFYAIWYVVSLFQRTYTSVFMVLSQQVFQKPDAHLLNYTATWSVL